MLPPPHARFVEAHRDYYQRRLQVCEREGADGLLVAWSLEEPLVYLLSLQGVPEEGYGFCLGRPLRCWLSTSRVPWTCRARRIWKAREFWPEPGMASPALHS